MKRNQTNSIKINYIINVFLSGSAYILPFITKPYVSRILEADNMGKVSFATSCISYFTMFAMLGVPTYGIRACAKVRDDKKKLSQTVQNIFVMNFILSILVYIMFGISLLFISKMQENKELIMVMSISIILNVIGMDWVYRGIEEYVSLAIRSLFFKFIAVLLIFVFVRQKSDYVIYGFCTVIASFGANIVNFIGVKKFIEIDISEIHLKQMLNHFRPALIFFAMSVATTIYTNLDVVMLGFIANDKQVGYYDATLTIKLILIGVVTSLGTVLLPRVSYYIEKGLYDRFWEISKKALNCILLIAIPIVFYFFVYAEDIILVFSGEGFKGAIIPLKILIPTILMIGLTNISGIQMLVPLGKEKVVLYSEIAGAVVDFLINLVLIPKLGAAGAAIGTLFAEILVLVIQFGYLRDKIYPILKKLEWVKIILASIIATFSCLMFQNVECIRIIRILISAIVFGIVYIGLLTILKEKEICNVIDSFGNKFHKKRR